MSGNFIAMVYAVLKDKGINTKEMPADEAVQKYNEIIGKSGRYNTESGDKDRLKKNIELSKAEYAGLCSAIRTKYADKIPKNDGILYKDSYYRYTYDKNKEQILCTRKIQIEGNEDKIKREEDYAKWQK